ncbi:Aspergillopepsin-2 [Cladobotryum mycophilum]|uniref:Aspergillopepsin-2 n=1 Tax=Cladobotryum mycophilum TaxID=491253 RepID=A0ABR0SJI7_9HYPO
MKYTLLLAAAAGLAAAAPNPKLGRRRGAHSLPNLRNATFPQYSTNWAGVVQIGKGYTQVQGTITVPRATGGSNAAASAWVGIDGDTCQSAILQTGVSFYGDGSFDAWYEWIPDYSYSFANFDLSEGDQIKMSVDASSKTAGVATLENLTTGQKVSHSFKNPPSTLCETNAEWIVEDFEEGGQLVPFADFGTVTFTDASASGSSGTISPSGGTLIDIRTQQGQVLTNCGISGSDVTCSYTGN